MRVYRLIRIQAFLGAFSERSLWRKYQSPRINGVINKNICLPPLMARNCFGFCQLSLSIRPMYPNACSSVSARKKIQATVTNANVPSILPHSFSDGKLPSWATTLLMFLRVLFNSNKGKKPQAWMNPQIMKFQLAPCQKPLTKKIMKVFRTACIFPLRDPPRGIYK